MKRTRTPKDSNLVRSEKMGFKLTKQEKADILAFQKTTKMKLIQLVKWGIKFSKASLLENGTQSVNNQKERK
jgi:hypothetical protein